MSRRIARTCSSSVVDPASGEVLEEFRLPPWWPKRLRPPRRLARGVSNAELALAGFAAGGLTEVARVAALHPLSTVKTRSQGNFEGDDIFADLYAGAGPSIAAAAPAPPLLAVPYSLLRLVGVALLDAEFPPNGRGVGVASARTRSSPAIAGAGSDAARRKRALLATASNERAPGVVGALRGIAATEGGDALFAGAAARVL
ncbi:hypothetical protein JL720_11631 [Aureococcus anophagefferens]|nr:hypothetical protein JL720_11631 [Aureococcus anophagefferens]